jgi:transcriptional regulator with XRE-family HTH domain
MSIFCPKKILPPVRVCLRLKNTREQQGKNLDDLARQLRLSKKYLLAIEECNFAELPQARAYRLAYLRQYALALDLNPDAIVDQFIRDGGLADIETAGFKQRSQLSWFLSLPHLTRTVTMIFIIVLFVGYLLWQLQGIIQPPRLVIYSPVEGYLTNEKTVLVQGETEPENKLTLNGQTIQANERGRFESKLDLTIGVNTISVSAIKKHGKITTVIRHVVAKE